MQVLLSAATWWWVIAGILIALELASNTFYLLMLALGAGAGALAAHAGVTPHWQMAIAAIIGGFATVVCYFYKRRFPRAPAAQANRDVNLDIGQTIVIEHWDRHGQATVRYRGANWQIRTRDQAAPGAGRYRIVEVQGNRLIVEAV